jgi:outer membrane protein
MVRLFAQALLLVVLAIGPAVARAEGLMELYLRALETNPTVRSRGFGVDQARAQEDLARSRLLPHLSAVGNYNRNNYEELDLERRYTGRRGAVVATQPLFDLAAYYRLKGAQTTVTQSEQERQGAEIALGGELIDRYLLALQAEDEIDYLSAEKAAIEAQLQRLRAMHERQLAKVTDLYEVEAYYQGLMTREIEARNARAIALERLRETTGVQVKSIPPLVREALPPVPGTETQWVADSVGSNPNLLALASAIEGMDRLLDSSRAEHLPTLGLSASQTYSDQGYDNRAVPSYNVATIGVQLTIPIYEGGRVQASVRDAIAKREMAREQYEAGRREIEGKVRSAFLSAQASRARIASTDAEVAALEKVVAAQQRGFELGVTTVLDVLIARQRLVKARSGHSKARYDYVRDLTVLRVQGGALNRANIEEIDSWLARTR